jgi:hypothetical protein
MRVCLTKDTVLRLYLRFLNPVVAVVVLVLGLVSASTTSEKDSLKYVGFFKSEFQIYFLGVGLFCSTTLFLLGKILERVLTIRQMLFSSRIRRRVPANNVERTEYLPVRHGDGDGTSNRRRRAT